MEALKQWRKNLDNARAAKNKVHQVPKVPPPKAGKAHLKNPAEKVQTPAAVGTAKNPSPVKRNIRNNKMRNMKKQAPAQAKEEKPQAAEETPNANPEAPAHKAGNNKPAMTLAQR